MELVVSFTFVGDRDDMHHCETCMKNPSRISKFLSNLARRTAIDVIAEEKLRAQAQKNSKLCAHLLSPTDIKLGQT